VRGEEQEVCLFIGFWTSDGIELIGQKGKTGLDSTLAFGINSS
jgi:hypothetical protein